LTDGRLIDWRRVCTRVTCVGIIHAEGLGQSFQTIFCYCPNIWTGPDNRKIAKQSSTLLSFPINHEEFNDRRYEKNRTIVLSANVPNSSWVLLACLEFSAIVPIHWRLFLANPLVLQYQHRSVTFLISFELTSLPFTSLSILQYAFECKSEIKYYPYKTYTLISV
jgi:hypothetical protein